MAVGIRCLPEASSSDPICIHKGCSTDSGRSLLSRSCLLLLILLEKPLYYFIDIGSQLVWFRRRMLLRRSSLRRCWASKPPVDFFHGSTRAVEFISITNLLFFQIGSLNSSQILISFIISPLHACQSLKDSSFVETYLLFQESLWFRRKTVCNLQES